MIELMCKFAIGGGMGWSLSTGSAREVGTGSCRDRSHLRHALEHWSPSSNVPNRIRNRGRCSSPFIRHAHPSHPPSCRLVLSRSDENAALY